MTRSYWHQRMWFVVEIGLAVMAVAVSAAPLHAQGFSSGSDGSDGAYAPTGPNGTVITFDPTQFHGTQVAANVFNFTTINIPAGVTVRLSARNINGPVVWLAQGDVNIAGTVDLRGQNGHPWTTNAFSRVQNVGGAGGYPGGLGGSAIQAATAGSGPSGGAGGTNAARRGLGGFFSGNQFLIPLVGGSGGGGGLTGDGHQGQLVFDSGGGAGGGAIMIASSTQISIGGLVTARGGDLGARWGDGGGGGSGGAIRLVANSISTSEGNTHLDATGGSGTGSNNGGNGVIRIEAFSIGVTGVNSPYLQSVPLPLLVQTTAPAVARVISINGVSVNPNPNSFPDITVNTTAAVPVVIQTQNIPATATIKLTILNQTNVADTVITAPALTCDQNNVCTTTVSVVFPVGASRGLTRVTWTQ